MIQRTLRQILLLAAIALVPALVSAAIQLKFQKPEPLAPGEVRAATVRQWGNAVTFVDARPRARFEAGHIPGAILLNPAEWDTQVPKFLDQWDPEKAVIVYCDGGECEASREVSELLRDQLQIKSVYVLKGGWPAWQAK